MVMCKHRVCMCTVQWDERKECNLINQIFNVTLLCLLFLVKLRQYWLMVTKIIYKYIYIRDEKVFYCKTALLVAPYRVVDILMPDFICILNERSLHREIHLAPIRPSWCVCQLCCVWHHIFFLKEEISLGSQVYKSKIIILICLLRNRIRFICLLKYIIPYREYIYIHWKVYILDNDKTSINAFSHILENKTTISIRMKGMNIQNCE